jgi:hypothetical protein
MQNLTAVEERFDIAALTVNQRAQIVLRVGEVRPNVPIA